MVMTEPKNIQDTPAPNDHHTMSHSSKKKRAEDQPLPPDLGLKPVQLQRRRVWRACESCRRKKIKCDGNEPTCSQCASSKSQCTWLQTKDRAALSRHYVQELEARLLHMETLFQQVAPILEKVGQGIDISSLPSSSTASTSSNSNILQEVLAKSKDQAVSNNANNGAADSSMEEELDRPIKVEDDMSEQFGQLALDEHGHMRWIGSSSTMSLIQSFRALTASPLRRVSPMDDEPGPNVNRLYFPASVFFGKLRALPGPEEVEYPERDLADKLVDAYFSRVHYLMPVIDKPSFLRQYKYVMDHTNDVHVARTQTAFIALVCAVFACAAKLIDDPRLSVEGLDDAGMGMIYYERALILHYISHASVQVEHVQCFVLLSSFLCSVNCLPQAWLLVGQAVRIGQDIGLHRSPRRLVISPIEKETRRKVWWGVYTLDRMLALALGRPLGVADTDCDVELPVEVDDENLQQYFAGANMSPGTLSLMKGFIELCTLYQIGGKVLRQVYALDKCKDHLEPEKRAELNRSVETLDRALTIWCDELPIVFKSQPINERQVSMGAVLCSHYYSILTTLHRNFLPVKKDQPVWPRSTAKAVSTARACIRLAPSIKNVVPPSHHLAFFIQNLFSSAVIILLYAMHTTDTGASQAAMEEARGCLVVLESWEGHWPGARKCKELLEDLTGTANEAIKAVASGQIRGSTSNSSIGQTSPTASTTIADRRMSAPVPVPERMAKPRQRRNRSRDVHISPHQVSTGQYRHNPLSQRARSTSRKRPHDEDFQDIGGSSLATILSSSYPGRSNLSSHSSPISVHSHPSPPTTVLEHPHESSPHLIAANTFGVNNPQSPTTGVPFDYGLSQSPSDGRWNGQNDLNGLGQLGSGSQPPQPSYTTSGNGYAAPNPTIDTSYLTYNSQDLGMNMPGLSTTPPSAGFNGPGLPFRGLDYIRNYNNTGYMMGNDQDPLWQTFDPNAFGYDPDIPFTLGDLTVDDQDGQQNQWP